MAAKKKRRVMVDLIEEQRPSLHAIRSTCGLNGKQSLNQLEQT